MGLPTNTTLKDWLEYLGILQDIAVINIKTSDDPKIVFKGNNCEIKKLVEESEYKNYNVIGLTTKTNCPYINKSDTNFDNFLIIYINK